MRRRAGRGVRLDAARVAVARGPPEEDRRVDAEHRTDRDTARDDDVEPELALREIDPLEQVRSGGHAGTDAAFVGAFKAEYFAWYNAIGVALQLFVVSRVLAAVRVGAIMSARR